MCWRVFFWFFSNLSKNTNDFRIRWHFVLKLGHVVRPPSATCGWSLWWCVLYFCGEKKPRKLFLECVVVAFCHWRPTCQELRVGTLFWRFWRIGCCGVGVPWDCPVPVIVSFLVSCFVLCTGPGMSERSSVAVTLIMTRIKRFALYLCGLGCSKFWMVLAPRQYAQLWGVNQFKITNFFHFCFFL